MTIDYELLQGTVDRTQSTEEEYLPGRLSNTAAIEGIDLADGYQSQPSVFRTFTPPIVPALDPLPEGIQTADATVTPAAGGQPAAAQPAVQPTGGAQTGAQPTGGQPQTATPAAASAAAPAAAKTIADLGALARHARGRSVISEAQAIAAAMAGWPQADQVAVGRALMNARASSPMFQGALARAMGASWQAIVADPQGINATEIQSYVEEINAGEAAASAYVESWWERGLIWGEAYVAAYVAQHTAADLASKLDVGIGPAAGMSGGIIGRAQRDGLITSADVEVLTSNPFVNDASTYHLGEEAGNLRQRFDEAQAALRALDQELLLHLHDVGPALYDPAETDPEKIRADQERVYTYMADFRSSERYQTAKREAMEAAQALGVELEVVGDDLLVPRPGNFGEESTETRTTVIDNYEALAQSADGAFEAVRWAESHRNDPSFSAEDQARVAQISQIGQETDAQAKVQTLQSIFQQAAAAAAPEQLSIWRQGMTYVKDYVATPYNQINTIVGASRLLTVVDEINRNVMIDAALRAGDTARAIQIARDYLAVVPPNAAPIISRVWSNLGVLLSTLRRADSLLTGVNDPVAAVNTAKKLYDNVTKLRDLMEAGQRTVDTEAQALRLVDAVKVDFTDFSRLGWGALDIAATLMTLQGTIDRAAAYPDNVALQINMICEFVGLFGSVLTVIGGPLAPLGAAISAIASVIGMVASLFIGDPEGDARRSAEAAILANPAVLGDEELAKVFTTPEASENMHAAQAGGVTRDQLLALGTDRPWLFEERGLIDHVDTIRTWLGRHPEIGRYTSGEPTLHHLLSTLDQRTLQELAYHGMMYQNDMRADRPFFRDEHMYVANQAAMLLGFYQFGPT